MAILHLRLDVDSEVHPELHAMLASIRSAASRSERIRQLASNGLIWEHLRVNAHLQPQVAATVGIDKTADEARAAPVTQAAPAPAVAADVVGGSAKPPPRQRTPPRNLPVLSDVVDLDAVADRKPVAVGQTAAAPPSAKRVARVVPEPSEDAVPEAAVEPASPPARKAGPRPRLMRMKEKGLFNNG